MIDIFLERSFDPQISAADFLGMAARAAGCMDLYRIDWQQSLYGSGGRKALCWFRGADLESVRRALRTGGVDTAILWSGTVHDAPNTDAEGIERANVLVQRGFDTPVSLDEIQAIEDRGIRCLEIRNVRFVRTFFSLDRRRMICLYAAPDAESVREAQREASMPVEAVWAFKKLDARDAASTG